MTTEDLLPKSEVVNTIIRSVIVHILKQIERELHLGFESLSYKCSVYINNDEVYSQIIDISGNESLCGKMQPIRIRFRSIFDPNKLKFRIESVFCEELFEKKIGFSGFQASGTINITDLSMKPYNWTIIYNDWRWMGWIK